MHLTAGYPFPLIRRGLVFQYPTLQENPGTRGPVPVWKKIEVDLTGRAFD